MKEIEKLVKKVSSFYKKEGRSHLPWRATRDPYRIFISELMLQQTQVDRVIPKYEQFIRVFPTFRALSRAPLSQVLLQWSGLGYNRRAKYAHEAAHLVVREHAGALPVDPAQIEALPGVGQYTARAVAAFAYDRAETFIETNIRTVFTHFLFPEREHVSDQELLPLIAAALPLAKRAGLSPRQWYGALMDYGSYLKKSGVRINNKSAHYAKQKKFQGSRRELRGALLRELLRAPQGARLLAKHCGRPAAEVQEELLRLSKEGLVAARGRRFAIVD